MSKQFTVGEALTPELIDRVVFEEMDRLLWESFIEESVREAAAVIGDFYADPADREQNDE